MKRKQNESLKIWNLFPSGKRSARFQSDAQVSRSSPTRSRTAAKFETSSILSIRMSTSLNVMLLWTMTRVSNLQRTWQITVTRDRSRRRKRSLNRSLPTTTVTAGASRNFRISCKYYHSLVTAFQQLCIIWLFVIFYPLTPFISEVARPHSSLISNFDYLFQPQQKCLNWHQNGAYILIS